MSIAKKIFSEKLLLKSSAQNSLASSFSTKPCVPSFSRSCHMQIAILALQQEFVQSNLSALFDFLLMLVSWWMALQWLSGSSCDKGKAMQGNEFRRVSMQIYICICLFLWITHICRGFRWGSTAGCWSQRLQALFSPGRKGRFSFHVGRDCHGCFDRYL